MTEGRSPGVVVRGGDLDGLEVIYSRDGNLILHTGESLLRTGHGWDMEASSPWRRLLPSLIFTGFGGTASSRLYITTARIVLVRDIDTWRELKGELTPLGIPNAAAKEIKLQKLRAIGVREYCEVLPGALRIVRMRRSARKRSWLDFQLLDMGDRQYALTLWKTDGRDEETASMVETMFQH